MCGISGIFRLNGEKYDALRPHLEVMGELIRHRGPDGEGIWTKRDGSLGFSHRRLSIIGLETGSQPMSDRLGNTITYNGEIYNYIELRKELEDDYLFQTDSDTEVILAAYAKWGANCLSKLRGMFAFAIWEERTQTLFCARDRFGIKPFYYTIQNGVFYFASEIKALIPFLNEVETSREALNEYLVFQFSLTHQTLFEGVFELEPAHHLKIEEGELSIEKYWDVYYNLDFDHTSKYFRENLFDILHDSIKIHTRSDVPIGGYVSGGIDSSIISSVASRYVSSNDFMAFTGKFSEGEAYDESAYARELATFAGLPLKEVDMTCRDFTDTIEKVIYHLDVPIAGPGSFPQYHVAKLVAGNRKVVLGGQGGDEIFGGYTRYLIAYFEQCIKAAIDGKMKEGNFIVTYESIIPNLCSLRNYKPLLKEFWKEGLFEELDKRYYRLINRAPSLKHEIDWSGMDPQRPFKQFSRIFNGDNVQKNSYFDNMTHFDFKTLLKALLQVEDRMSMAHGIESRVPFVDHKVVEFAATMPSDIKFKDGTLKMILVNTMQNYLPKGILERKNKMGFPVPINDWLQGELKPFIFDIFNSQNAKQRPYFKADEIIQAIDGESKFGRKIWGLLSLELWHRQFHDKAAEYKKLLKTSQELATV